MYACYCSVGEGSLWSHRHKLEDNILDLRPFGILGKVGWYFLPTFRDNILVLFSGVKYAFAWPLKMGPKHCPETSVRNYHSMLRKIPKQCKCYLHRSWGLKLRTEDDILYILCMEHLDSGLGASVGFFWLKALDLDVFTFKNVLFLFACPRIAVTLFSYKF